MYYVRWPQLDVRVDRDLGCARLQRGVLVSRVFRLANVTVEVVDGADELFANLPPDQWTVIDEPAELVALRALVAATAERAGVVKGAVEWQLGFGVLDRLTRFDYHNSPVNALAFAATGGDGIHIGLVTEGAATGAVILTVPPGVIPNTVLASTFLDLLALGYYVGFDWLEELGYSWDTADVLSRTPPRHFDDTGRLLVEGLRNSFELQPPEAITERLRALNARFAPHLAMPDEGEWDRTHGW